MRTSINKNFKKIINHLRLIKAIKLLLCKALDLNYYFFLNNKYNSIFL